MKQVQGISTIRSSPIAWFGRLRVAWRGYRETHRRLHIEDISPHLQSDLGFKDYGQENRVAYEQIRFCR